MDKSTHEFVEKLHENEAKQEKNLRTKGYGNAPGKLSNKQHRSK